MEQNNIHSKGSVLIVDDEKNMRLILSKVLEEEDFNVLTASNANDALNILNPDIDVVITDVRMEGLDGMQLLEQIKKRNPDISVLVMTAYATISAAVEAMKKGALTYISKPFNNDEIIISVKNAIERKRLLAEKDSLRKELSKSYGFSSLVGKSQGISKVKEHVNQVARTDSSVLILGESGVGKELVAKAIHFNSFRSNSKFIAVNCGAIPVPLLESELMGYEKGAFTGAHKTKQGLIEASSTGTLFLDEIGDMPFELQAKLLRVLEEKTVRRVGGLSDIKVDIRLITATHFNLEKLLEEGRFRKDLYYRINIFPIFIPPLRERKEDIPLLVEHFIHKYNSKLQRKVLGISDDALEILIHNDWTGNVRELEHVIERALIIKIEGILTPVDLPPEFIEKSPKRRSEPALDNFSYQNAKELFEKEYFISLLSANKWNISHSAQTAGISRRHLQEKIKQLGIIIQR